jgi:hypothetical protein
MTWLNKEQTHSLSIKTIAEAHNFRIMQPLLKCYLLTLKSSFQSLKYYG